MGTGLWLTALFLLGTTSSSLADFCTDYCDQNPCLEDEDTIECPPGEIWKPESSKCGCCGSCIIPIEGSQSCKEWSMGEEPPKEQCRRQFICIQGHCDIVYVKNPKNDATEE